MAYYGLVYPISFLRNKIVRWLRKIQICWLQKNAVRIIENLKFRESCRDAFRSLGLLTLPCLYILEVALHCRYKFDLTQGAQRNFMAVLQSLLVSGSSSIFTGLRKFFNRCSLLRSMLQDSFYEMRYLESWCAQLDHYHPSLLKDRLYEKRYLESWGAQRSVLYFTQHPYTSRVDTKNMFSPPQTLTKVPPDLKGKIPHLGWWKKPFFL
ncbi:hypothetical protein J6590_029214 [Homalodisca vitripennis]|nr:hypothetical protein J6590_029214 [Homalodisca vitripennis]